MKLLKRSTVNIETAQQKRIQIEEGLNLAKKVDALRQTLGSLQQQHEKFLAGMEDELKRRTDGLLQQVAIQKLELVQVAERRKELERPLTEEWEKVKISIHESEKTRDILAKGLLKLADKEKVTEEKYADSKKTLARINMRERELTKAYEKANQNIAETEKVKEDSLAKMARVDKYIEEKTQEYLTKEAELKAKERDLETSAQKIVDDRNTLLEKETLLKDREATLERELKRQKKK